MFGQIGYSEIVVIVFVLFILFGRKEFPKMIRSVMKVWRDIQKSAAQVQKEIAELIDDDNPFK